MLLLPFAFAVAVQRVPCKGAYFQCFLERSIHGHRLQPVGTKCADLVSVLETHTSAQLGCSHWYDTLTLAEGQHQLDILRRDTQLNFVRPKGGNTVALENSFDACGKWGVEKEEKIWALLAFTTPSICLRPDHTPGTALQCHLAFHDTLRPVAVTLPSGAMTGLVPCNDVAMAMCLILPLLIADTA